MNKKALVLIPVAAAILIVGLLLARREPAPEPAKSVTPPKKGAVAVTGGSTRTPSAPPVEVKSATAEQQGRILHQSALDQRVRILVRARMSGDKATADALQDSLLRSPSESKPVVQERLAKAELPREKEILQDLLRQLP